MIKILDFDCLEFLPGGLSSYELTPLDVFQTVNPINVSLAL